MARDDLSNLIEQRLEALEIGKSELARRAGLSRQSLHKLLTGEVTEAKVSTFVKLASALEMSPLTLMRELFHATGVVSRRRNTGRRSRQPISESQPEARHPGDGSGFIADITIPDNSLIAVGSRFDKSWEIINKGKLVWEGRRLWCADEQMRMLRASPEAAFGEPLPTGLIPLVPEVPIPTTHPGESVRLTAPIQAPEIPGTYLSYWKMVDAEGEICFPHLQGLSCQVQVVAI